MMKRLFILFFFVFLMCASILKCTPFQCAHPSQALSVTFSEYYLVLLVDARHLDYSNGRSLLKTMAKHPRDGSKNGDVGHAWILLSGTLNGKRICIEGGHSGEAGETEPCYLEGIWNAIEFGNSNPSENQIRHPTVEPNPIKYLWQERQDGFFQKGSGGHLPTYAVKVNLSRDQFLEILNNIHPAHYDYSKYSIIGNQCSSFVERIAALAGLELESKIEVPIPSFLRIGSSSYPLWRDPIYCRMVISSPDVLEGSMKQAVVAGKAEYALKWYYKHRCRKHSLICRLRSAVKQCSKLSDQCQRARLHYLL